MDPFAGWSGTELVAFDLETTGVDRFHDVPVSYALVVMRRGEVDSFESSIVDPGCEIPTAATAIHGISTAQARADGVPLQDAVALVGARLLDASRRGVAIVGMKLDYDLTMLDCCYRREFGRGLADDGFCGPVLDALVLDRHFDRWRKGKRTLGDLCVEYEVVIEQAHDAVADAKATLGVLRAMCGRYATLHSTPVAELHTSQVGWHRDWADSLSSWRMGKGIPPLDARDGDWPIAFVDGPVSAKVATAGV
ncbi:MAG: exonuclease domain-containing protein [Acidimicrobiales bacterium]